MRQNYTTWHEMFFLMAFVAASRSKDPSTQNGTIIVNPDNIVVGTGYNGFLRGMKDSNEKWQKPLKYRYVYHAEENAIANSFCKVNDCRMYLWSSRNYYPCEHCSRSIVQHGIVKIHLLGRPDPHDLYQWDVSREILREGRVAIEMHNYIVIKSLIESKLNPMLQKNL